MHAQQLCLPLIYYVTHLYTQDVNKSDIHWYADKIRDNLSYHLAGPIDNNFYKIYFTIANVPPRIFEKLFKRHVGKEYEDGKLTMGYTQKSAGKCTYTSRIDNGFVPIGFMSKVFRKGLPWTTISADSITRDISKVHVTWTLPLGNISIEVIAKARLPNSSVWQSLEYQN